MLDYYLKIYREISTLTYYNFDIYHLAALRQLVSADFSGRDLQMLSIIENMKGKATPSFLSNLFHMKQSAVSNRLTLFEKRNLIKRVKSDIDTRSIFLFIATDGLPLVNVYNSFINQYLNILKRNFSIFDIKTIASAVKKFKRLINPEITDINKIDGSFDKTFLIILQDYFHSIDINYIESTNIKIKVNDLFILTEFYLYIYENKNNIKAFSDLVYIPYQTIDSKIKRFEELKYFTRADDTYIFNNETINLVKGFMTTRIIAYFDTITKLNDKEKKIIHEMFTLFGEFSKDSIK